MSYIVTRPRGWLKVGDNFNRAKHYVFNVAYESELTARQVNALTTGLRELDIIDGPAWYDVFPTGVVDFHWQRPIFNREQLEKVLSRIGLPYRYTMQPYGTDHDGTLISKCSICEDYTYTYGVYCAPIVRDVDWKSVDPSAISARHSWGDSDDSSGSDQDRKTLGTMYRGINSLYSRVSPTRCSRSIGHDAARIRSFGAH